MHDLIISTASSARYLHEYSNSIQPVSNYQHILIVPHYFYSYAKDVLRDKTYVILLVIDSSLEPHPFSRYVKFNLISIIQSHLNISDFSAWYHDTSISLSCSFFENIAPLINPSSDLIFFRHNRRRTAIQEYFMNVYYRHTTLLGLLNTLIRQPIIYLFSPFLCLGGIFYFNSSLNSIRLFSCWELNYLSQCSTRDQPSLAVTISCYLKSYCQSQSIITILPHSYFLSYCSYKAHL